MDCHLHTTSLKQLFVLLGFALLAGGCSSTSQQSARFCDDSGCSERPLSVSADYLNKPAVVKSEEILKLEEAAASEPKAAYDLSLRYFRGDGVQRNSYQALQWMRKAGHGGLLEAQKALGGYYLSGFEEMGSDPQEAEKWLSMAAAQGDQNLPRVWPKPRKRRSQKPTTTAGASTGVSTTADTGIEAIRTSATGDRAIGTTTDNPQQ